MSTQLSREEFQAVMPPQMRKNVSQELIDRMNAAINDPEFMERYKENVLGYVHVLKEGRFKMESYLNAVRYCSYKIMGDTNIVAFSKTFPDKIQDWNTQGKDSKEISSYVSAYAKSKLVLMILDQAMMPVYLTNADTFQKAINKQVELMNTAKSEMVQHLAAKELMNTLKKPETTKMEIDISTGESSELSLLREQTLALAEQQRQMIAAGQLSAKDVAHSPLTIEGELDEDGA